PDVLEAAGISDPILVGHSDGASISILYAAEHPVRGLILEAPHVFGEEVSFASIARAKEAYEKGALRERLAKYHENVDAAFYGWNGPWLDPGFRKWNVTDRLPRISAPILVVQGLADEYGTTAQVDAIRDGAAGKVDAVLLEGAGHSPHRDKPEETLAASAPRRSPAPPGRGSSSARGPPLWCSAPRWRGRPRARPPPRRWPPPPLRAPGCAPPPSRTVLRRRSQERESATDLVAFL